MMAFKSFPWGEYKLFLHTEVDKLSSIHYLSHMLRLQRECVMPVDCETHDPSVRGLAEACMSQTLPPSTLKRQTISESTGRTEKLSGWGEHSHLELSWLQHCASSLLQCSCPYCHGYSVIMLPSSLMFSWLLLEVWAGFPLWLDIIMDLSLRVAPTLLGNEMLCGRGLTTVELYGLLLAESLLRLVLLLLVTRWESNGVRHSFSRMRSPSSSSSSLSPSAMLLL